ncbi:LysR family transcriptional regulator [Stappia taiwanensis]|uniref:LysR family transcriptional regulator n=1 Tax=Stappia taiwanensis TaxID=992267 RepID=A0A838XNZ6_9HYPH|nr:LysR family transcriptional regulator [Stappia taiwanensis]MBA4611942.1 LysR family transcriptional regulator [Stappia taiwanensis]GGF03968.1 LysR family transcriptional regulator [Stappia taiwanensis]
MKVTLRQIECFLAVAEFGNFSRASRRMNLAQPALSQAIRDLEAELATRLFDRTTRRVELTEAGREFRASAQKIYEDLEDAVQSVHDLAERKRGRIRIAAPPLLAAVVLPQAIADFRRRHPGISVELADVGTEQILDSVRSGRADCGLGTFSPAEDGIERVPLSRDSLMLFCDQKSAFNGAASVSWADLAGQPLITLTRDSGIRLLVEVGFETAEVPLKPAYEVSQITTAIALVEAGLGIAVLPTYALAAAQYRKVSGKLLTGPSISREVVMIHATGRSVSPAVSAFSAVLRRYAQQLTPRETS